jgi:hypothetical protein
MDLAQRDYIRKQCLGFDVERLARVYDNYVDKTFEELVELVQAERRDMEERDRGGSRPTHRRAPPTPSSAPSVLGNAEIQVGRIQIASACESILGSLVYVADDLVNVKRESPIDLTQEDEEPDYGEIDHEPHFVPEGPEPSEYDGEDSSDISTISSDGSHDVVPQQAAPGFLRTTRRARLRQVGAWLEGFEWKEETQKTDVVDYCWDLESSAVSLFLYCEQGGAESDAVER